MLPKKGFPSLLFVSSCTSGPWHYVGHCCCSTKCRKGCFLWIETNRKCKLTVMDSLSDQIRWQLKTWMLASSSFTANSSIGITKQDDSSVSWIGCCKSGNGAPQPQQYLDTKPERERPGQIWIVEPSKMVKRSPAKIPLSVDEKLAVSRTRTGQTRLDRWKTKIGRFIHPRANPNHFLLRWTSRLSLCIARGSQNAPHVSLNVNFSVSLLVFFSFVFLYSLLGRVVISSRWAEWLEKTLGTHWLCISSIL